MPTTRSRGGGQSIIRRGEGGLSGGEGEADLSSRREEVSHEEKRSVRGIGGGGPPLGEEVYEGQTHQEKRRRSIRRREGGGLSGGGVMRC